MFFNAIMWFGISIFYAIMYVVCIKNDRDSIFWTIMFVGAIVCATVWSAADQIVQALGHHVQ